MICNNCKAETKDFCICDSRERVFIQRIKNLESEIKELIYKYSVAEAARQSAELRLRAFEVDFQTKDI